MKTFKYKTLKGLLRANHFSQFTFQEFISGRFCHKTHGLCRYVLSDEARDEAARKFAGVLYSRPDEEKVSLVRRYGGREYGILRRLFINRDGRAEYCAGQDYPGEIRTIQHIMRSW